MEQPANINKKILITGGVALVVAFGIAGYFVGEGRGMAEGTLQGEAKYKNVVEAIYPKPPKELHSIIGTVTAIYGATLQLEANNPTDYLPHTDGSPRVKETLMANTTPATKYVLVDYSSIDTRGNPKTRSLAFSAIKTGATITVETAANIMTAQRFDVTKVTLVKY